MGKKVIYTQITPLPSNVPRQLALDLLHNHSEVIRLNPLVKNVKEIPAPQDAPSDEYFSNWYEIAETITWGFGLKKNITFRGVFHDQPYGVQSHVYAPMNIDLRNKYRIGGNQPGEPPEVRELGVDTPREGLYLREDHEITCNMAVSGYVKKEMKDATKKMFERMIRKAELLDEGKMHGMFEDGKLKTIKAAPGAEQLERPPGSPGFQRVSPEMSAASFAPVVDQKGYGRYHDVANAHRQSQYGQTHQSNGHHSSVQYPDVAPGASMPIISELPANTSVAQPLHPDSGHAFRAELSGDSMAAPPSSPPSAQASPYLSSEQKAMHSGYPPAASDRNSHPSTRSSIPSQLSPQQPSQWQSSTSEYSQSSNRDSTNHDSIYSQQSTRNSSVSGDMNGGGGGGARSSTNLGMVPDHRRFSQLSLQPAPINFSRPSPTLGAGSGTARCPVCSLFEGDEAAVNHHVSRAHFT